MHGLTSTNYHLTSKTNYKTFSTNNSYSTIQIAINGFNIEKVNSTKYLGVYIDHHLNWKDHIAYISSKLSKSTAVFHKTSHVLDTKTLTLLHNAIIFSYLGYCVEVWGNTHKTNLYPLFIKQKKLFVLFTMLSIWTTLLD